MTAETALELHPEADAEIEEAFEWYRQHLGDARAARLLDAVNLRLQSIREAPERWPIVRGVSPIARLRIVRGFAYTIFYRVRPAGILVLALAHHRRQPLYWSHRR